MTSSSSLYEQIGGADTVRAVVVKLYKKILSDDRLTPFFEDVAIERLRASQNAFVGMAFGGPIHYSGKNLRDAHRHLVARGLNDSHFNAVARHLKDAMAELGVTPPLIEQALAIVETTRADILDKPEGEHK